MYAVLVGMLRGRGSEKHDGVNINENEIRVKNIQMNKIIYKPKNRCD